MNAIGICTLIAALALVPATAQAQASCGLCNSQVVINSDLATCFLKEYDRFARTAAGAVVVDLSGCESARGVVEALPSPNIVPAAVPDLTFMVLPGQLNCLKRKLEEPGLVLDPSAVIALDSCG